MAFGAGIIEIVEVEPEPEVKTKVEKKVVEFESSSYARWSRIESLDLLRKTLIKAIETLLKGIEPLLRVT